MPFCKPKTWFRRLNKGKARDDEVNNTTSTRNLADSISESELENLQQHLNVKKTVYQERAAIKAAIAKRDLNPRPRRQAVRTHYCSKFCPPVPPSKRSEESLPLSFAPSSASSTGRASSLIRTATSATIRVARTASNASRESVVKVWREGMLDAFEKPQVYNPPIKPPNWCSFVFRGNPWLSETDPEYNVPLAVRKVGSVHHQLSPVGEPLRPQTVPCTPLHQDPVKAARRQQSIIRQFGHRLVEPDMQERPVSPLSDPQYDGMFLDAPRHTSVGPEVECDSKHSSIWKNGTWKKVPFKKDPPCLLCKRKSENLFSRNFRRRRAVTTAKKVDKMATILSRHPSQTDLTDLTEENGIELKNLTTPPTKSGRPKALTSIDPVMFNVAFENQGYYIARNVGIGPSSAAPARFPVRLDILDHRKPCLQLPGLDSHPPSRRLSHESVVESNNLLSTGGTDNASTMALKRRPMSVTEHLIEGKSSESASKACEAEKKENQSSGSDEDVDQTAEGTSAWATKVGETRVTTPGSEDVEEVDSAGVEMGRKSMSKAEAFDPRDLEERLREFGASV